MLTKRITRRWGMLGSVAASKNDRPLVALIQTPNDEYFDPDLPGSSAAIVPIPVIT